LKHSKSFFAMNSQYKYIIMAFSQAEGTLSTKYTM